MMLAMTIPLSQPQICVCWRPNTVSPTPLAISRSPRKSSLPGRVCVCGRAIAVRTSAMIATGTFTQKIERQVHSLR